MLTITISGDDYYDEEKNEFFTKPEDDVVLEFEHSLVALSKWESIYEKPYLGDLDKTPEEVFGYIKCMLVTPNVSPEILSKLSQDNIDEIVRYIEAKNSATWFSDTGPTKSREVITNELIYYWMDAFGVPMECQHWHLNRLFNLIRIHNIKMDPNPKKMGKQEWAAKQREINQANKIKYNTSG